MSEEKLYAVKNDEGKYWNFEDQDGFWKLSTVLLAAFTDEGSAKSVADEQGGHIVTLTEEPEKVVVSEEEAEMLETAKNPTFRPSSVITSYSSCHGGWDLTSDLEDRLMRAYVNGYTVAKEKKYNLVLGTDTDDGTNALFQLVNYNPCTDDALGLNTDTYADDLKLDEFYQFTQEEIDKYNKDFWIKNIDLNDYKVEVTDDDAK